MLLSPLRIHDLLQSLLSFDAGTCEGLHTALLLVPQGQLIACATTPYFPSNDTQSVTTSDQAAFSDLADEEDEQGEEPYLDAPERLRLLSGLASQWEDDDSPRVECEVRG
jgi:hypothetical protein